MWVWQVKCLHPLHAENELTRTLQSASWETNTFSTRQQTSVILSNPVIYYRLHDFMSLFNTLCCLNRVQISISYVFEIHFNITLPPTPSYSKLWPTLRFSSKTLHTYTHVFFIFLYLQQETFHILDWKTYQKTETVME